MVKKHVKTTKEKKGGIISKENLSATFTVNHEFLFIVNNRNIVVGGLYYKRKNNCLERIRKP